MKTTEQEQTCDSCPAFCHDDSTPYAGWCRAELPKEGPTGHGKWVKVSRTQWCMKHPKRKW